MDMLNLERTLLCPPVLTLVFMIKTNTNGGGQECPPYITAVNFL